MNLSFKPKNIVILTGAGISAESGIRTFRDANGLWENHDIMEVASPGGFERDPELVHRFYNQRRAQLLSDEVHPNAAHLFLAKLEKEYDGNVSLVTQNVDDLHERAGSENIIHMHGELLKMRCKKSGTVLTNKNDLNTEKPCPCCLEKDNLRPHIVWFGEYPLHMDLIMDDVTNCDLFISIGTSGVVYPAAMFVTLAKENGAHTVELNIDATQVSDNFDDHMTGSATETVKELVHYLLSL